MGTTWKMVGGVRADLQKIYDRFKLICCVDPFRNEPLLTRGVRIGYFRLHGFGKPSMYMYRYSKGELKTLLEKCASLSSSLGSIFLFFNNASMYENAREFIEIV